MNESIKIVKSINELIEFINKADKNVSVRFGRVYDSKGNVLCKIV